MPDLALWVVVVLAVVVVVVVVVVVAVVVVLLAVLLAVLLLLVVAECSVLSVEEVEDGSLNLEGSVAVALLACLPVLLLFVLYGFLSQ